MKIDHRDLLYYLSFLYTYYGDNMNNDSLVFLFNSMIKETRTLKVDFGNTILKINR